MTKDLRVVTKPSVQAGGFSLSKYFATRTLGQRVRIFHRLRPKPIEFTCLEWEDIKKNFAETSMIGSRLEALLHERSLLVRHAEADQKILDECRHVFIRNASYPSILYLLTSRGCNLSCKYCPVPRHTKELGQVAPRADDGARAIDAWFKLVERQYDPSRSHFVILYGGEPLLNWPGVVSALQHLEKAKNSGNFYPENLKIIIATNGVLLTSEVASRLKAYGVIVQIGLDGLTEETNRHRIMSDDRESVKKVMSALDVLRQSKVEIEASVAVTPQNLEFVATASKHLGGMGISRFGFNMLRGRHLHELVSSGERDGFFKAAAKAIIDNSSSCVNSVEAFFERKWRALNAEEYFPVDCTCYGNQLVMHADGGVGCCPFDPYESVFAKDEGEIISATTQLHDEAVRALFSSELLQQDWICMYGGGCAWSRRDYPQEADAMSRAVTSAIFGTLIWKVPAVL